MVELMTLSDLHRPVLRESPSMRSGPVTASSDALACGVRRSISGFLPMSSRFPPSQCWLILAALILSPVALMPGAAAETAAPAPAAHQPNRLIHERSPYLRQHADNPVDWYPWGEEARSEEQTSELQSRQYLVCRLL